MSASPPSEVASRCATLRASRASCATCATCVWPRWLRGFLRRRWFLNRRRCFAGLLGQAVATGELERHHFIVEPYITAVRSGRSGRQPQMEVLAAAVTVGACIRTGWLAAHGAGPGVLSDRRLSSHRDNRICCSARVTDDLSCGSSSPSQTSASSRLSHCPNSGPGSMPN